VIIIITQSSFDLPGEKLKSRKVRMFVFAALGALVSVHQAASADAQANMAMALGHMRTFRL